MAEADTRPRGEGALGLRCVVSPVLGAIWQNPTPTTRPERAAGGNGMTAAVWEPNRSTNAIFVQGRRASVLRLP